MQIPQLTAELINILLIAYLGRWSMERRFRPNL